MGLGCTALSAWGVSTNPEAPCIPGCWESRGFLRGHHPPYRPPQARSPLEGGGGAGSTQPLSPPVFLVTSPHPAATRSHLVRAKDAPVTQEVPTDLGPESKAKH